MRLVFMGTPDFAAPVLEALLAAGHEVGIVVTQPDRRGNRGKITYSPVKEIALRHSIEVLQPQRLSQSEEDKVKLREYAPDAMIVVAYGQILKQDVLDIPKYGCFNVHASLLPKLRGASPIQHSILLGEEKTGVTVMKIGPGLDDGDMIAKAEISIERKNASTLSEELSQLGAKLLVETLPHIEDGTAVYTKQNEEESTYAGMISKKDGNIHFADSADAIECKIRAFDPWPGAFAVSGEDKIRIWRAEVVTFQENAVPGTIVAITKEGLDVACGKDALRILEVQAPGKKRMACSDYLRGHKLELGDQFGEA